MGIEISWETGPQYATMTPFPIRKYSALSDRGNREEVLGLLKITIIYDISQEGLRYPIIC